MQVAADSIHGICSIFIEYLFFQLFLEQKPTWKLSGIVLLLLALGPLLWITGYVVETLFPAEYFVQSLGRGIRTIFLMFLAMLPLLGKKRKKVLLVIALVAVASISELLAGALHSLITGRPFNLNTDDFLAINTIVLLSSAILFAFVAVLQYVLLSIRYGRSDTGGFRPAHLLELAIPLVSVVIVCFLVSLQQNVALFASALVLALGLFAYLLHSIAQKKVLAQNERARQQALRETHYRELERHQAEIRALKHDMKNQLIAMNAYVQTGSAARAGKEIQALITQLEDSTKYTFTENAALNGLLAQKYRQAEAAEILCDFHIGLPAEAGFADADMVAFLGNVLDNAIEACQHCDGGRYIKLEIACRDGVLLLKTENSTDGRVLSNKTRKRDRDNHGLGLANIRRIVDKYHGEMQYRFLPHSYVLEATLFGIPSADLQAR